MTSNIQISILLVCYNQEEYIDQCIDGILIQQVNEPLELIVADDGSIDSTLERIRAKVSQLNFPVNFLPSEENLGIGKNYYRGVSACKGNFVAFLEGDDYWTDSLRLQKHINFLKDNPQCPMSFNTYAIFLQNSKKLIFPKLKGGLNPDFYKSKTLIHYNLIGNLSACVARKAALDEIPKKCYDYDITDWFMGIFLAQKHAIAQLKEIMSVYRITDKGLWSRHSKEDQPQIQVINATLKV